MAGQGGTEALRDESGCGVLVFCGDQVYANRIAGYLRCDFCRVKIPRSLLRALNLNTPTSC
jgi:hypothetical protein